MKKPYWRSHVVSMAEHLIRECSPIKFPVDLGKLALKRAVERVHFKPMPCEGAIEATPTGFELQLNSEKDQTVPTLAVDTSRLTPRERFTFAHEISHTFFYGAGCRAIEPQPTRRMLEGLCNYGAQCLLLPRFLVEREIGMGCRLDSIEMARDLATVARVSTEIVLRRIDEWDHLKADDYALLILARKPDGIILTKGACLSGFFLTLPKPELQTEPPNWLKKLVPALERVSAPGTREQTKSHRVRRDYQHDFICRMIVDSKQPNHLYVEVKLDLSSNEFKRLNALAGR